MAFEEWQMLQRFFLLLIVGCMAINTPALAEDFPVRPIKIVSPYPPGGTTDILARMLAPPLQLALGQPVIVENRAGASGNIGTEAVARAKPGGYTLLLGNNTGVAINPNLYKLNINPALDLAPVILIAYVPLVLCVNPTLNVRSLPELVSLVKAQPRKYSFASAGSGSPQHLAGEMLNLAYGLDLVHVPFKGSGPAITGVLGGQPPIAFESTAALLPFIEANRLRALATTGAKRSATLANVPTMIESGQTGFEVTSWYGLFAPTGTSKEVTERLNHELNKILSTAEMKDRLAKMGSAVVNGSSDEFASFIRSELPRWADAVKKSNATVD
jgi:tripartite-type tricarboxylate transporter receptor subunit TctC